MDKLEVKAAFELDDAGTISGVAWPFNAGPDAIGDLIERGAFQPSAAMPILYEHDGGKAIGSWESIEETDAGLQVKGRLFLDSVPLAREAYSEVKSGRTSGLSIGYRALETKTRPDGGRTILSLHLAEISIVGRPCHPLARISEVKSIGDATTSKEQNMEPEVKNDAAGDPVIEKKDFDALRARLDKIEAKSNRPIGLNSNNPDGENDNSLEKKAFTSFARRGVDRMEADEVKALTVSDNANGGFLAPETFASEVFKKLVEFSPIRAYAKVISISAPEIKHPRRLTGTAASWVAEVADRPESGMTFDQVTLTPYELATFTDISNQLLEDNAYNLEGLLQDDFAESFGKAEASAFVTGDGAGKPRGLLNAPGIAEMKTGAAATLGADPASSIIAMFHALPAVYAQNGVWIMNRKTLGTLRSLKDGDGRFILCDPISAGAATTLLGRPIVEAIDFPDVAAGAFPIMFGDLSGYRITDRTGLSVLRDPFTQKIKGVTRFHANKRVGGDVTHADHFVKLKVAA